MASLTRSSWLRLEILPPTLMVVMGHPWLGAATLGAVLAATGLQAWLVARTAQERHRAILSYAQDATSMGNDPTTVIAALQGKAADEIDELLSPSRADEQDKQSLPPWPPRPPRF
jgi:hypothetical protein